MCLYLGDIPIHQDLEKEIIKPSPSVTFYPFFISSLSSFNLFLYYPHGACHVTPPTSKVSVLSSHLPHLPDLNLNYLLQSKKTAASLSVPRWLYEDTTVESGEIYSGGLTLLDAAYYFLRYLKSSTSYHQKNYLWKPYMAYMINPYYFLP